MDKFLEYNCEVFILSLSFIVKNKIVIIFSACKSVRNSHVQLMCFKLGHIILLSPVSVNNLNPIICYQYQLIISRAQKSRLIVRDYL